jgi:predicted esterase
METLIETDRAYRPYRAGWMQKSYKLPAPDQAYQGVFHVRVPRGYDPDRRYPLLMVCHGQGGNGRQIGRVYARLLGEAVERHILVCPTLPGPQAYKAVDYQERAYLDPLSWVRRNLNVDDDRICVTGYSLGGHSTWHLGLFFARHFAAAIPMAGVPITQGTQTAARLYLENLAHLRMWHIWAEKDRTPAGEGNVDLSRAADKRLKELGFRNYRGREVAGAGHGGAWPPSGEAFAAYLNASRRTAWPREFSWRFSSPRHSRGYYVDAVGLGHAPMDFDGPIRVRLPGRGKPPSREQIIAAAEKMIRQKMFSFQVAYDPEPNRLTLTSANVRTVRVYVSAAMVDLSRPLEIRFGSSRWKKGVPASAACMLEHYAQNRDERAIVHNVVELGRGRPAVLLHKP